MVVDNLAGLARAGTLVLRHVSKSFERGAQRHRCLADVDLTVQAGSLLVILGPSGCGKSTLLRIIAGLELADPAEQLELTLDGARIDGPSHERGLVFQAESTFPWLTVKENVMFGLPYVTRDRKQQAAIADSYLRLVGLTDHADFFPRTLSGGQRQRVALARTLAMRPRVLLMDEPYAALDAFNRERQQVELLRIWRETRATIVFVTHDIAEAAFLGTRVLVMSGRPGRILADVDIDESLRSYSHNAHPDLADALSQGRGPWLRERPEFYELVAHLKRSLPAAVIESTS